MSYGKISPDLQQPILLCAAHVFPMAGRPLMDGAVACRGGRIVGVGSRADLRKNNPDARVFDLGDSVILPGLVNAHTHLELSHMRPGANPGHLADWILTQVLPQASQLREATAQTIGDVIQSGAAQCLGFGVTSVGDISRQCPQSRPVLKDGPLRVVSYGEVQAMAKRRGLLDERFAAATDLSCESPWLRVGVTPHAPYTVEEPGYARCLEFAKAHRRPLATHLAETPDESALLSAHNGPFRRLWDAVDGWDQEVPKYEGGPIRLARDLGLLDYPTLLAHVNYCDDDELEILSAGKASVVYCPRTHAYFGHSPHRWREMLERGINVAVGTDSRGSSPDLNLVDDLRLLHRIAPETPVIQLWEMATIRAARAIGWAGEVGSMEPGKRADFTIFSARGEEPLKEILESNVAPTGVWIDGIALAGAK